MSSQFKARAHASSIALFVVCLALPAMAGSVKSYKYTEAVTGVKNTKVTASFSFNSTTDKISGTLSFTGGNTFNGITDNFSGKATCNKAGSCVYTVNAKVNGDTISYTIDLNQTVLTSANGSIWNKKNDGTFAYAPAPMAEATSRLDFLVPAGMVMFGGIVLCRNRRRDHQEA